MAKLARETQDYLLGNVRLGYLNFKFIMSEIGSHAGNGLVWRAAFSVSFRVVRACLFDDAEMAIQIGYGREQLISRIFFVQ